MPWASPQPDFVRGRSSGARRLAQRDSRNRHAEALKLVANVFPPVSTRSTSIPASGAPTIQRPISRRKSPPNERSFWAAAPNPPPISCPCTLPAALRHWRGGPASGGALEDPASLEATPVEELKEVIRLYEERFKSAQLQSAWERVLAVVIQPGVDFGDRRVAPTGRS